MSKKEGGESLPLFTLGEHSMQIDKSINLHRVTFREKIS